MVVLITVIRQWRSFRKTAAEFLIFLCKFTIAAGKPKLQGLPATYTEKDEEAQTLCVKLKDEVTGMVLELLYTIFPHL